MSVKFELSDREIEILRAAHTGLSNREIGEKLGLKMQTVKNNLTRIYEKLGVKGRAEILR